MSKQSHPAAVARAAGAADPVSLSGLTPEPQPESAHALTVPPVSAAPPAIDEDDAPLETYDPAEYRWVPVRRRPRFDGWTEEKQRRFIETLADTGLVNVAARASA